MNIFEKLDELLFERSEYITIMNYYLKNTKCKTIIHPMNIFVKKSDFKNII